ncbi:hypothetical protein [Pedobacter sp. SYSU D00535]|uniref:hypothetical protein n=1 Tax=Pedobacter sp. SYSU D00535 TaxID=2810308 RepID=UPI001A966708|nr:hypothetical protein [Pedobacter sp. SYSU D00535]
MCLTFLKLPLVSGICLISILFYACGSKKGSGNERPSLKEVVGIKYIEVRREFDTGFSFNEFGFQQVPEWTMKFFSEDSVMIYSPKRKRYLHYLVHFDHDSVYNIAREWVRMKTISKDSLVFQLLEVEGKEISRDRSNVLMKFYSEEYLASRGLDTAILRRPNKKDSAFVRSRALRASRNPGNLDSAFAARSPVHLESLSPDISVQKSHGEGDELNPSAADEYLYPEYRIEINGAWKNFDYKFTVLVDQNGKLHLGNFLVSDEFRASRKRVLEGIIKLYLEKYLRITPGNTLGVPHTSEVLFYVKGRTS